MEYMPTVHMVIRCFHAALLLLINNRESPVQFLLKCPWITYSNLNNSPFVDSSVFLLV